jgi:hypothetical protein
VLLCGTLAYARGLGRGRCVKQSPQRAAAPAAVRAPAYQVPRSGTGGLAGLRGEGGFQGEFGKGSDGYLDYWFE